MIFAEAIDRLVRAGKSPLIWQSMQLTGATAGNVERQRVYHRTRLGYATDPEQ
jgi:hypothetical protein